MKNKFKKKIVFFDTWVSALRQFDHLAKSLFGDYHITFLSLDKMHNKYLSKELVQNNRDFYKKRRENDKFYNLITDISEYDNSIFNFFKIENPDIVFLISLHNLDHRWFNICAQYFEVSTYLVMHGIKGESVFCRKKMSVLTLNTFKRLLFYNKLYYYYLRDKRKIQKLIFYDDFLEWKELIFNHNKYKFSPQYFYNVKYSKLFVTTYSDISFFKKYYPLLRNSNFFVIGTLDMVEIINKINSFKVKKDSILFVGQPLRAFLDNERYISIIGAIKDYASGKGLKFVFRPHPREEPLILARISGRFEISTNSLAYDLASARCVFGFNSTVLLSALNLGLPIVSFVVRGIPHPQFLYDSRNSFVFESLKSFYSNRQNFISVSENQTLINPIEIIKREINE